MRTTLIIIPFLVLVSLRPGVTTFFNKDLAVSSQSSIQQFETKLKSQYVEIQKLFASPPSPAGTLTPAQYRRRLREWQDDLAQSFMRAAATVQEMLALN